jgi:hypothetical protein
MSNRLFAAYGVGVNRAEMAKRCPTAKLIGAAGVAKLPLDVPRDTRCCSGEHRTCEKP